MQISVRTVENNLKILLELFAKKGIKLLKYICGKEVGKTNKNEHFHYHFVVDKCKITADSLKTSIRRFLYNFYKCKNFYVKDVKDTEKHELYVTKDGDYESDGYSSDELELIDEKNSKINYDKSLPVYQKVYNVLSKKEFDHPLREHCIDRRWLISQILKIHLDWDACPPTKTDMFRYINYVLLKEDLQDICVENYI